MKVSMASSTFSVCFLLCLCLGGCLEFSSSLDDESILYAKILNVGDELVNETLSLQMGSRLYQFHGLKPTHWYKVKISYPASIPARFSLQLKTGESFHALGHLRRLLNTEKLIFEYPNHVKPVVEKQYVLVSVEPEGVVAQPLVKERKHIMFNIVCDELYFGLPRKAWWVGILAIFCIGCALFTPFFLPSTILLKDQTQGAVKHS